MRLRRSLTRDELETRINKELEEDRVINFIERFEPSKLHWKIILGPFAFVYIVWAIKKICNKYHWSILEYREACLAQQEKEK